MVNDFNSDQFEMTPHAPCTFRHGSQGSYFYECVPRFAQTITACTEGNLLLRFQLRPKEERDGSFRGAQRKRIQ